MKLYDPRKVKQQFNRQTIDQSMQAWHECTVYVWQDSTWCQDNSAEAEQE